MHASMRANIASRMIRADLTLGYDKARARDYQWLFTNERIPATPQQHVLDGMFSFVEYFGLVERDLRWDIPIVGRGPTVRAGCVQAGGADLRNQPVQQPAFPQLPQLEPRLTMSSS